MLLSLIITLTSFTKELMPCECSQNRLSSPPLPKMHGENKNYNDENAKQNLSDHNIGEWVFCYYHWQLSLEANSMNSTLSIMIWQLSFLTVQDTDTPQNCCKSFLLLLPQNTLSYGHTMRCVQKGQYLT